MIYLYIQPIALGRSNLLEYEWVYKCSLMMTGIIKYACNLT